MKKQLIFSIGHPSYQTTARGIIFYATPMARYKPTLPVNCQRRLAAQTTARGIIFYATPMAGYKPILPVNCQRRLAAQTTARGIIFYATPMAGYKPILPGIVSGGRNFSTKKSCVFTRRLFLYSSKKLYFRENVGNINTRNNFRLC